MHTFCTPLRFSDVFRAYRKSALGTVGLGGIEVNQFTQISAILKAKFDGNPLDILVLGFIPKVFLNCPRRFQ